VYTRPTPRARPVLDRLRPPSDADIVELLTRGHRRVRRLLARRGRLGEDDAGTDPFAAQEPLFAQMLAASLQSRVALGPRTGWPEWWRPPIRSGPARRPSSRDIIVHTRALITPAADATAAPAPARHTGWPETAVSDMGGAHERPR
jgi:hypothetical protein